MAKEKFDVDTLHQQATLRHERKKQDAHRDPRNHHQLNFEIDVKKSYEASLELCKDADGELIEERVKHLESVLSAGPTRYDH